MTGMPAWLMLLMGVGFVVAFIGLVIALIIVVMGKKF